MRKFEGCVRADEVAMTRKGANSVNGQGLTTVLVAKSATENPTPENAEMEAAELAKAQAAAVTAILSMDDVQKAHYLALPADAQVAFLAKSADERKVEADTAKAAKDKAAAEAEAVKTGKTQREIDLEKRLTDQAAEIEALKAKGVEADIEKRAKEEFDGFPGGVAAVVPLLKSYAKLPEAERKASEDVLKSQAKLAKMTGTHLGAISEADVDKSRPAHAELAKKAADHLAANPGLKNIEVAKGAVLADPANADLFARVGAEENAARGLVFN